MMRLSPSVFSTVHRFPAMEGKAVLLRLPDGRVVAEDAELAIDISGYSIGPSRLPAPAPAALRIDCKDCVRIAEALRSVLSGAQVQCLLEGDEGSLAISGERLGGNAQGSIWLRIKGHPSSSAVRLEVLLDAIHADGLAGCLDLAAIGQQLPASALGLTADQSLVPMAPARLAA